jgi:hypothetical protein
MLARRPPRSAASWWSPAVARPALASPPWGGPDQDRSAHRHTPFYADGNGVVRTEGWTWTRCQTAGQPARRRAEGHPWLGTAEGSWSTEGMTPQPLAVRLQPATVRASSPHGQKPLGRRGADKSRSRCPVLLRSCANAALTASAWAAARRSQGLMVSYLWPVCSSAARKLPPPQHGEQGARDRGGRGAETIERSALRLAEPGAAAAAVVPLPSVDRAVAHHVRGCAGRVGAGQTGCVRDVCGHSSPPFPLLPLPVTCQQSYYHVLRCCIDIRWHANSRTDRPAGDDAPPGAQKTPPGEGHRGAHRCH